MDVGGRLVGCGLVVVVDGPGLCGRLGAAAGRGGLVHDVDVAIGPDGGGEGSPRASGPGSRSRPDGASSHPVPTLRAASRVSSSSRVGTARGRWPGGEVGGARRRSLHPSHAWAPWLAPVPE